MPVEEDRLAGLPVFVAQGEQDRVIPRELLDRTWTYLHGDSGAEITGHRDGSAHTLSPPALVALADWLVKTTAAAS